LIELVRLRTRQSRQQCRERGSYADRLGENGRIVGDERAKGRKERRQRRLRVLETLSRHAARLIRRQAVAEFKSEAALASAGFAGDQDDGPAASSGRIVPAPQRR